MRHRLATTAGSDAHFANEIGNAGIITEAEDIRKTLMKNDIRVWLIILFAVARLFPPYNDLSSGTCIGNNTPATPNTHETKLK